MSNLKNDSTNTSRGVVTEALPSTLFRVLLDKIDAEEPREILAYLSGKMRMNRIKVLVGDKVEVFIDTLGGRGRITKRL